MNSKKWTEETQAIFELTDLGLVKLRKLGQISRLQYNEILSIIEAEYEVEE